MYKATVCTNSVPPHTPSLHLFAKLGDATSHFEMLFQKMLIFQFMWQKTNPLSLPKYGLKGGRDSNVKYTQELQKF